MREIALLRGLTLTSQSRPLRYTDLSDFHYIVGMDFANMASLQIAAEYWADSYPIPSDYQHKVQVFEFLFAM